MVSYFYKLTYASLFFTKIDRFPHLLFPNLTQSKKSTLRCLNDHEDCPILPGNIHQLCDEMGHSVEQILASEKINPKEQDCENQSRAGKLTIRVRSFEKL